MKRRLEKKMQRGVSLLVALLSLVALSLATLALVRSVDTSSLVLGNIGFKQDATATGDQAARQALAWLKANVASLDNDAAVSGYYASTRELNTDKTVTQVDVTGQQQPTNTTRKLVNWDSDGQCKYASGVFASCALQSVSAGNINGNEARYVIFRLCAIAGDSNDDINNSCAKPLTSGSGASGRGALAYGSTRFTAASGPYYRIVVRVIGARNTTSFTETIVNFQ